MQNSKHATIPETSYELGCTEVLNGSLYDTLLNGECSSLSTKPKELHACEYQVPPSE